jgi:hypothetical protein
MQRAWRIAQCCVACVQSESKKRESRSSSYKSWRSRRDQLEGMFGANENCASQERPSVTSRELRLREGPVWSGVGRVSHQLARAGPPSVRQLCPRTRLLSRVQPQ